MYVVRQLTKYQNIKIKQFDMNKIFITAFIVLMTINSFGQSLTGKNENIDHEKTVKNFAPYTYRLFPTENMWTFIKLNTRNGKMWQVQYSMSENERFESYLSLIPLVEIDNEIDNRFTLYPTQNTWTFILLDQIDGRTWQVQWSINYEKRGIMRIEQ